MRISLLAFMRISYLIYQFIVILYFFLRLLFVNQETIYLMSCILAIVYSDPYFHLGIKRFKLYSIKVDKVALR